MTESASSAAPSAAAQEDVHGVGATVLLVLGADGAELRVP